MSSLQDSNACRVCVLLSEMSSLQDSGDCVVYGLLSEISSLQDSNACRVCVLLSEMLSLQDSGDCVVYGLLSEMSSLQDSGDCVVYGLLSEISSLRDSRACVAGRAFPSANPRLCLQFDFNPVLTRVHSRLRVSSSRTQVKIKSKVWASSLFRAGLPAGLLAPESPCASVCPLARCKELFISRAAPPQSCSSKALITHKELE